MTKQRTEIVKAVAFNVSHTPEDMEDMMKGEPLTVWITRRNGNFKRIEDVILTEDERKEALNYIVTIQA